MDWMGSNKRFLCASIPTGSGKSLLAALASKVSDRRAIILTATKGLQSQLLRDFSQIGMNDIRGQNSYQCLKVPGSTVDDGPCHLGEWCELREHGCHYYDQLRAAQAAKLVVTNYSYYLTVNHYTDNGLGHVPLLVLDEAHLAFRALESFLEVRLDRSEVESAGISLPRGGFDSWSKWQDWAFNSVARARDYATELRRQAAIVKATDGKVPGSVYRAIRSITLLVFKLESIFGAPGRWVSELNRSGFRFTPVWPGKRSDLLFMKSDKVLIMSAIMTPKTADLMQVSEDERQWLEVPSYYPPRNTPIQHIFSSPTLRVDNKITDMDKRRWVNKIDQILDRRTDRIS